MDKKGIYYAFKITLTEEGPVGELLEDLNTIDQEIAEKRLFELYLKDEKDIAGKIGQPFISDIIYNGHKMLGLSPKDVFAPTGEFETKIKIDRGFICLYCSVFWNKHLIEKPNDIYLVASDDDNWQEQLRFSQRENL